jgi:hypothetical protein
MPTRFVLGEMLSLSVSRLTHAPVTGACATTYTLWDRQGNPVTCVECAGPPQGGHALAAMLRRCERQMLSAQVPSN